MKKNKPTNKPTNIIITGIGGQGVLTLAYAIAESAMRQGYDVKMAEIHGLAMRFGHIEVHVRYGKQVYSPLVQNGEADLIVGLEPIEVLRCSKYMSKETNVVFDTAIAVPNKMHLHREEYPKIKAIIDSVKKISKSVKAIPASEIAKKQAGSGVYSNIYLLGILIKSKLIDIKPKYVFETLQFLPAMETNTKIFKIGLKVLLMK